jgi:hypothetical protein
MLTPLPFANKSLENLTGAVWLSRAMPGGSTVSLNTHSDHVPVWFEAQIELTETSFCEAMQK